MSRIHIGSAALQPKLARSAQVADASFIDPVASETEPANTIDYRKDPPDHINVMPFGVGGDGSTFTVRVIGWKLVAGKLWVPQVLCEFLATLSAFVGVAGSTVTDTQRFADTVADPTANVGREGTDCWKRSPANDTPAQYRIKNPGCVLFRLDFKTGTATSGNALIGTE